MAPDEMCGTVPVDDGHLHIHEDDVRLGACGLRRRVGFLGGDRGRRRKCSEEVVQSFAAVPDCLDGVPEFADGAEGDLLVYCAGGSAC